MTNGSNDRRDYDPLDRTTFDAIAYNAVGRASEISTYAALSLTHSNGNSGWSVGIVQWDFGQPGRGEKVNELLSGYQAWARPDQRFSSVEVESLTRRLQTRGQSGNALTDEEQTRLNDYLRSDPGRELVSSLNQEQIDRKWERVGEPLSQIEWLRDMRQIDPAHATEIVAQTMKLYNQNEARGERLIAHLQNNEMTSAQTRDWIGTQGINGLIPDARQAIVTGRDNALAGARLMNALELGTGRLAQAWQREVHESGNQSLYEGFNNSPDIQLLDGMMRNPVAGRAILDHVDNGQQAQDAVIRAARPDAALEMSRVELTREGELTVTSPSADIFEMTREGWNRNGVPMQGRQQGSAVDDPDYTDGLRARPLSPDNERHPDHAMLNQIREGVRKMDEYVGKRYDEGSERLSHALLARAKENGMTSVDQVVIGTDRRNMFAVAGDPRSIANFQRTHVPIVEAIKTPIEQSDEKLAAVNDEIQRQQEQARLAELTRAPDDPGRGGSPMRM